MQRRDVWKVIYVALSTLAFLAQASAASIPKNLAVCDDITDPVTLDPHREFSDSNHTLIQQIYEGLVRLGPDGSIEPALAVSWQRKGPLRMRFKLRKGVRFHNGEPFNAEAVRFSIARLLAPKTGYPGLGLLRPLREAVVVNDHTVDVITESPDGILLNRLAFDILMVPPKYIGKMGDERFARNPVGTGAFRFAKWEKGKRIVLKANEEYWMKGFPKVDRLSFEFIPKREQIQALFDKRVDLLMDAPGTRTLSIQEHPAVRVVKGKAFYTVAIGLRFSQGPLVDRRVRRAMNYAIDRGALIRYDLLGNGVPLATFSMPGEEGHNPRLEPYPYDPEKARKLLAEAGYPKGLILKGVAKQNVLRTARIIAADFKRVGIQLDITPITEPEVIGHLANPEYDLGIGGMPDPLAHAYFIQAMIIYSKSPYCIGKNPKFDAMLEEMVSTIDKRKRIRLAEKIDEYIYKEALSLFTYQRLKIYGVRKGLHFDHYPTGQPYFFSAYFD